MRDLYIRWMELPEPLPRESYLNRLPVVKYLAENKIEFHKQVTFFVGENGSGKSTLIEALAISQGFNPEGGTKNFCFHTENSHSELHSYLRVARGVICPRDGFFLRAESFYNVATNIDEMDRNPDGIGAPIISNYGGVSLHKQSHGESFLALAQFIISTHSPMLLCFPDAEVYQITKNGIDSVRFQDTDHFRTTVRFLQNPESAVADILGYETEE